MSSSLSFFNPDIRFPELSYAKVRYWFQLGDNFLLAKCCSVWSVSVRGARLEDMSDEQAANLSSLQCGLQKFRSFSFHLTIRSSRAQNFKLAATSIIINIEQICCSYIIICMINIEIMVGYLFILSLYAVGHIST